VTETSHGPLRVRSVVGLAYDELRAMIVDGRLAPGARVGQAELADALGISRGSVREALRRLAGDGLVEFEVNQILPSKSIWSSWTMRPAFDGVPLVQSVPSLSALLAWSAPDPAPSTRGTS